MAKTQLTNEQIADGTIIRDDINITTSGKALIRKIVDVSNSGVSINASSGVDAGTGDVSLKIDRAYLDTQYPSMTGTGANLRGQNKFFAGPPSGGDGLPIFRTITPSDIPALDYAASSHSHSWSDITSGKPTTLSGYGITDAISNAYLSTRSITDYNLADSEGVMFHYGSSSSTQKPSGSSDGSLFTMSYSNVWSTQLYGDWRTNDLYLRSQNSGTWGTFKKIWHEGNFAPGTLTSATSNSSTGTTHTHAITTTTSGAVSTIVSTNTDGAIGVSRMGLFGTYSAAQTQQIWSIGSSYKPTSTTNFGTLYGLGYSYIGVGGSSLASKHQIHFAENGTAKVTVNLTDGEVRASRFTSLIAAGTAPFTVTSDTVVTNLNADLLDGRHGNQFINLEANTSTSVNNLDWNTLSYSTSNPAWHLQPIHTPNFTGQTNAPFQGTSEYGTMLTLPASLPAQFGHQIAFGHLGTIKYRSVFNDDNFTSPWIDIWTTATFNPANYVPINGAMTINDTKTFSSSPIVPTPTSAAHAVRKDYVDNNYIHQDYLGTEIIDNGAGQLELDVHELAVDLTNDVELDFSLIPYKFIYIIITSGTENLYIDNFQRKQRFIIFNDDGSASGNGVRVGTLSSAISAGTLNKGEKVSGYVDENFRAIFYDKTPCGHNYF